MKKIFLLLLLLPMLSGAQTIADKASELMSAYTARHTFSGNVLIARSGKIIFQKSYGYASIAGHKKNTAKTVFRAGSLTKMFTAALVLRSAELKKLSLTDAVSRYLPQFPGGDSLQLQHLLSHSSGITGSTAADAAGLKDMIAGYKPEPPAFAPGTGFQYNNFNYLLLSAILEKVWNKPLPELLQKEVFRRSGMVHSGLDFAGRTGTNAATGYTVHPSTNEWVPVEDKNVSAASGAGSLYTTAGDLFAWAETIRSNRLLDEAATLKMTSIVQADYGLGWIIRDFAGHKMYGHTGTIQGFNAAFMIFPQDSVTVIYLSNLQDMNAADLERNLFALALDMPYKIPVEKKIIHLEEKQLQEYAGTYKADDGTVIGIAVEAGKLVATAPGGDKIILLAEAADRFFMQGIDSPVTFSRSENTVTEMTVVMGGEMRFKKN